MQTALAMDSLCFCPPDRLHPCWRTSVSTPSGILSTSSSSCAMRTARATSSSDLLLEPNAMLRLRLPENTTGVWGTYPIMESSSSAEYSLTSCPPTETVPDVASYILGMRSAIVDFPLAVGPMTARVCPFSTVNDTSFSTSLSVPGYLKETWSKTILPGSVASDASRGPSLTDVSWSMTSCTLLEDTSVLGRDLMIPVAIMTAPSTFTA